MTLPTVIVPVKSSRVKSRLADVMAEKERLEFSRLLLAGVLRALDGAGLIGRTYVVTPDGEAARMARRRGAKVANEARDNGVNSAVLTGIGEAGRPETVLVIPSDLPLLRPSELREVVDLKSSGFGVVIAPSRAFDGTNALAFSPDSGLTLSYDADSFWNHLASAARAGMSTAVCTRTGLVFDVDSPADFGELAHARGAGPPAAYARRVLG